MNGKKYPSPATQRQNALKWKNSVLLPEKIIKKNKGTKSTEQQRKDALEYAERHFSLPTQASPSPSHYPPIPHHLTIPYCKVQDENEHGTTTFEVQDENEHGTTTFECIEDFCSCCYDDCTCREAAAVNSLTENSIIHSPKPTVAMATPVNDYEVYQFTHTMKVKLLPNGKVPNFTVTVAVGGCSTAEDNNK